MAQVVEVVNVDAEAVTALRTVAPQVVEILRNANERYIVQAGKLATLAEQIRTAKKPFNEQAKPDRKTLRGLSKQWAALKPEDEAKKFKTLAIKMSEVGNSIKAIMAEAETATATLATDAEAVRDRIAEIDAAMPKLVKDAFVQALIAA